MAEIERTALSAVEPTDDLDEVVRTLREDHPSAQVVVHDPETEKLGYWDEDPSDVEAHALHYLQSQGFRITRAGLTSYGDLGECAWIEARRAFVEGVDDR